MKKIRIGVLGPSDIAFRRTIPAMVKSEKFEYVGLAHADREEWGTDSDLVIQKEAEKCRRFIDQFGGKVYDSYRSLLRDASIDAVYIPLPPSLHKKWAMVALEQRKNVILEKPFTTSFEDTKEIIQYAIARNLTVHENYAFLYHKQIEELDRIVSEKEIGELRLIRATFSFPYRGEQDFRYHKSMGGGAIIDCGGYPLKLATHFLGQDFLLADSILYSSKGHDVDVYGCAALKSDTVSAQISWGMDNAYRCNVELFGSKGFASTQRVYSPTAEMQTSILLNVEGKEQTIIVEPDDQFMRSIECFADCVMGTKQENYQAILNQAKLIDQIIKR